MIEIDAVKSAVERVTGLDIQLVEMDDGKGKIDMDALLASGWQMRDIPLTRRDYWDQIIEAMGEPNYRLLAKTERRFPDGEFVRGQFIISPEGFAGIKALGARMRAEQETKQPF